MTHIYNTFQCNQYLFQDCCEKTFLPHVKADSLAGFVEFATTEVLCVGILPPFLSILCKFPHLQRIPFRTIGQTFTGGWFCFLGLQTECYELGQSSLQLPSCLFFFSKKLKNDST